MTNFNFLLNNLSYQSSEELIGRPMDSTCLRSASVLPSFRLRLHPLRMVATLLLVISVGVGNVWGAASTETFDFSSGSYNNTDKIITWTGTSCTIVQSQGGSNTAVNSSYTGTNLRWYASHDVTFTPKSNITITSIVLVGAKSGSTKYYGQTMTEQSSTSATITNTTTTTTTVTGSWTPSTALTLRMGTQFRLTSVTITYCKTPSATSNGTITSSSAVLNWTDAAETNNYQLYWSTSSTPPTSSTMPSVSSGVTSTTYTISSGLTASTTYYWWVRSACSETSKSSWKAGPSFTTASAAACEANPSIGNASLNGSISLSSIPLSISSVGGGTDCTLAEYGFVWKAGSTPSASDNKTKIGESSSATSFTGNITGSFSTGVTYYIKGYAINNGPNTTLSSTALTITPRSITFNSNGGSSVSTIYVNSGTAASAPTAPTKTGYNFGGWYTDNGTFASAVNWSSTISENKTYYAKWTAKTTEIALNKNNSDASGSTAGSVNYTYGQSTKDSYSTATRTGYTLNGYYTATSGGTKILNADGTIAGNSIVVSAVNYTDASGNWAYDGTSLTLYAQWTAINYTVTWKVNNVAWTPKTTTGKGTDGSDNADYGTKVSTLPTAPDPDNDEGCGNKFMGWTNAAIDGSQNSAPAVLFTTAGSSPTITGNTIFHAVFADYGE